MCGQKNEEDEEKKKGFCTFTLAAVRSTVGGVRTVVVNDWSRVNERHASQTQVSSQVCQQSP